MKKIYFLLTACISIAFTSCMDGGEMAWQDPVPENQNVYGNKNIKESNVITIQQLKDKYKTAFQTAGKMEEVKEDIQIKGYVTSNDIEGNMYNEITIEDETNAIFLEIAQGGVYGYLPIGTEIIVDLKGLTVGNYRCSALIGTPYTSKDGAESVGKMSRFLWQQHFTYTGKKKEVKPTLFADGSTPTTWDFLNDDGKLGILKNVTFKKGGYYNSSTGKFVDLELTEESRFAVTDYSTSWYFNEQQSDGTKGIAVQLYNSAYADFAALPIPQGKVNITGVFKHYENASGSNKSWEIIIRSLSDIEEVK